MELHEPENNATPASINGLKNKLSQAEKKVADLSLQLQQERQLRKELIDSELLYRAVFENTGAATCIVEKDGTVIQANSRFAHYTGYAAEEIINNKKWMDFVVEEDLPRMIEQHKLRRQDSQSALKYYEFRFFNRIGQIRHAYLHIDMIPGTDMSVASIIDITEHKETLEKVRQNESLLNLFFSQSLSGFFMMMLDDPVEWHDGIDKEKTLEYVFHNQRMTRVNQALLDQYGATEENFIGSTPYSLFKHDLEHGRKIWRGLLDKGRWHIETHERRFDGTPIIIEGDYICIYDDKGRITGHFGVQNDVTERKKIERSLRESEKNYRQIADNISDVVWVMDLNMNTTYISPSIRKLAGYSPEEYINKNIAEKHPPESLEMLLSILQEELAMDQDPLADKNRTRIIETQHYKSDGSIIHISMHVSIIRNKHGKPTSLLGVTRDITERKEIEEKFKTYINNSPTAVFITNLKGDYIFVNPSASELLGYSEEELLRKNISHLAHPDDYQDGIKIFREIINGATVNKDISMVNSAGEKLYVNLSATLLNNDSVIGYCVDVSDRRKLLEEIIKAKEKAEESNRLKSAFLANMSHEIRTPMNGILGFMHLLKEPDLESTRKNQYIDIINQSGKRLLDTINDIIEISMIESGQARVSYSVFSAEDVMQYHYDFFKPETSKKNLYFKLGRHITGKQAYIHTDKHILESTITNLLKNAIKFTDKGGIQIGNYIDDDRLVFFVKDSGEGIPKDRISMIFKRFVQADTSMTRQHEGSGLGLSIVKAYLDMIGGKIWVESEPNKGSTFYFSLPYVKAKVQQVLSNQTETQVAQITPGTKILVAEDEDVAFQLIQVFLKKFSVNLIRTTTGFETVDAVKADPGISLILMDWRMPGMNGLEATKKIREFNQNIPIVAQTAQTIEGDKETILAAGCNDYISKPINQQELISKIALYANTH